jgi:hypothetical protein
MTPGLPCPAELTEPLRALVAETAISQLRHAVRNKLSSLRNAAFYLQRKLEAQPALLESDPRLGRFLTLLDTETASLAEELGAPLTPAVPSTCDSGELLGPWLKTLGWPEGTGCEVRGEPRTVRADEVELKLLVWCLCDEAVRGGARRLEASVVLEGESVVLTFGPVQLTADRQPVRVANKLAERAGGRLELREQLVSVHLREAR